MWYQNSEIVFTRESIYVNKNSHKCVEDFTYEGRLNYLSDR